jgi:short-subunit dehydrogenase
MKNAIVVGASSGIGRELARVLAANGYSVGLAARRVDLLRELAKELSTPSRIQEMDVADTQNAMAGLERLIDEMGDVDLFVLNAGVGFPNWDLDWQPERETIAVNVTGFAATANVAVRHLMKRGRGHLVGISSIAALAGHGESPAYPASKAFMSNYMSGLRHKFARQGSPITVTDVLPGFVDTAMLKADDPFWVATPEKAARQIYSAIVGRKKRVYITRRWRMVAWLIRLLPDWIAHKL